MISSRSHHDGMEYEVELKLNSQDLIVDSPLYLLQISLKFSKVNLVLDQDNKF